MPRLPGRPELVLAAPFAAVLAVVGGLALEGSAVLGLGVLTALVGAAWAGAAWEESPIVPPGMHRVGIAGLGVLGRSVARALAGIGYAVRGWSRRPSDPARSGAPDARLRSGRERIRFGKRVVRVEQHASGVTAWFDDGSQAEGDFMVAADGTHSVIRHHVLGEHVERRYAGYVNWNGLVTIDESIAPADQWTTFVGEGKRVSLMPVISEPAGPTRKRLSVSAVGFLAVVVGRRFRRQVIYANKPANRRRRLRRRFDHGRHWLGDVVGVRHHRHDDRSGQPA